MARIRIAVSQDAHHACVTVTDAPPEHQHVWLWDLFFAATLHGLDATNRDALRERLEHWAVEMAGQMFAPEETLRDTALQTLGQDVALDEQPPSEAAFELVTTETHADWPGVEIDTPDDASAGQRRGAILALARYLIEQNVLFIRELPVHVLALRKYYTDVRSPADEASIEEAPVFALAKAGELFTELSGPTE